MRKFRLFSVAVLTLAALSTPTIASAKILQCVPFAREVSGVDLRGNAYTWWNQADGKYERGHAPRVGAVMAMPSFGSMRNGHVATVAKVISDREVLIDHANWSRPGMVERGVRAVDVSEKGDWSRVRVWHAGSGDLGLTSYPVSGFIYNDGSVHFAARPKADHGFKLSDDVIQLASLEQ
ncbi:CHAP domain-containing protein [Chakrabartia godavariana]|nr:CHAP domain-containing protein [Chakrabartia godavariana]